MFSTNENAIKAASEQLILLVVQK